MPLGPDYSLGSAQQQIDAAQARHQAMARPGVYVATYTPGSGTPPKLAPYKPPASASPVKSHTAKAVKSVNHASSASVNQTMRVTVSHPKKVHLRKFG